jgi:peptidoglycan hydrolase-like protein with peptidoglycan-binding domain
MRPNESFVGQPIRSLQTMLRVLAEHDSRHTTVVPDGIYGPTTLAAVSNFQRLHGLPVTGVTDQDTWDAIVAEYEPALIFVDQATPVEIILNPNEVLQKGTQSPYLYVAQALLTVLAEVYSSIGTPAFTGILDEATADALATFQALSGLPVTGDLDKITWKHLALHFPLAANLRKGNTQAGIPSQNMDSLLNFPSHRSRP